MLKSVPVLFTGQSTLRADEDGRQVSRWILTTEMSNQVRPRNGLQLSLPIAAGRASPRNPSDMSPGCD